MEESTDDCSKFVVNWTIHNFSYWNGDIHDPVLETKDSWFFKDTGLTIELYPRGISGCEEQLVVRLCGEYENTFKGDLSFIASDGSLLGTRQFDSIEYSEGVLELPPGPKFRDVVEHITKNEALHKDQLTLRLILRFQEGEIEDSQMHIKSMIEAFETTVKIHLEQLIGRKQLEDGRGGYVMEYPLNDGETVRLVFIIKDSETAADSIEMILLPGLGVEDVKYKFAVRTFWSLLNSEGSVLRSEQNDHVFRDKEDWVISNSLTKEEAKGCSVVIDFKIIPSNGHKLLSYQVSLPMEAFEVIKTSSSCFHETCHVLKTDLMCLYQDQDFSDLQLKCGDVTIPIHKNILSARSPVFKTMFSTDMAEAVSSEVEIGDLDPSTLGLFLTYLYTGAVEDLQSDRALKLYYAADKYQVPSLKKECADFLRNNVSIDNVCDILSLAHKHEDDQLKSVSHTLILNNYNEVLASEQWGSFMRSEPLLALETLTQFAKNKMSKGVSNAL